MLRWIATGDATEETLVAREARLEEKQMEALALVELNQEAAHRVATARNSATADNSAAAAAADQYADVEFVAPDAASIQAAFDELTTSRLTDDEIDKLTARVKSRLQAANTAIDTPTSFIRAARKACTVDSDAASFESAGQRRFVENGIVQAISAPHRLMQSKSKRKMAKQYRRKH